LASFSILGLTKEKKREFVVRSLYGYTQQLVPGKLTWVITTLQHLL